MREESVGGARRMQERGAAGAEGAGLTGLDLNRFFSGFFGVLTGVRLRSIMVSCH